MPRAKAESDRVLGPYEETDPRTAKKRWRLIVHKGGRVTRPVFETREGPGGALETKGQLERQLVASASRTIEEALCAWEVWRRAEGIKESTLFNCAHQARGFFYGHLDKPLAWLTSARSGQNRGQELYEARRERPGHETGQRLSAASVKAALRISRQFCSWCVGQKWLAANPLADTKGSRKDRVNRRKAQLSIDEGRVFFAQAEKMAEGGDIGALAVMTAFLLGLRQSELTHRVVRDLDDNGRLLRIDDGKTEASKGTMEVPETVRPHLLRLAKGKTPLAPLFESPVKRGHGFSDYWLREQVHRVCIEAGVGLRPDADDRPRRTRAVISAHSLRGMAASWLRSSGAAPHVIAQMLRHADKGRVARDHYIDPRVAARTDRAALAEILRPVDE